MYVSYYQVGGSFDFTEYVFGEDNCCDEYPVPISDEERVYFEKENYADFTDPENWIPEEIGDEKNSNNDNVSSGIYFYSIQSGEFQATKKMILLD